MCVCVHSNWDHTYCIRKHTHLTSSPLFSSSSFWKSSLLTTLPPVWSLQPLVFHFFTQLVIPSWSKNMQGYTKTWISFFYHEHMETGIRRLIEDLQTCFHMNSEGRWKYTVNSELAVCVDNQLLDLHMYSLLQRLAGCLNRKWKMKGIKQTRHRRKICTTQKIWWYNPLSVSLSML